MKSVRLLSIFIILTLAFSFAACSNNKTSKLQASLNADEPHEGRDRELFEDALKEMQKKRYEQGRLLINTLVTTYGDSPLLSMAKLTIADSYYREGGSSNLVQAEAEYKDWLQFFPNHELAQDVLVKMAEIHLRQLQSPDRSQEHTLQAEKILLDIKKRFPQASDNPKVKEYLDLAQEKLAKHDLNVAQFYYEKRDAPKATISRCADIVAKYPNFTEMDAALWFLGQAFEQEENTEDASKQFARLVREFPTSKYRDTAAERLERFGKPVPDPAPDSGGDKIYEKRSMMARVMENLFAPSVSVSKEGILLKEGDKIDEATYALIDNAARNSATPISQSSSVGRPAEQVNNSGGVNGTTTNSDDSLTSKPKIKDKKKSKKKAIDKT